MNESHRATGHLTSSFFTMCFVGLVSFASANATIVPHLDLSSLYEKADLIVVGRIMGQQRLGTTSLGPAEGDMLASLMLARVDVEKVLKGHLDTPLVTFRFVLPYEGIGYRGVSDGRFGTFFLSWKGERYDVLNPYFPYVPAAPGGAPIEGNCVDKITGDLARVFVSRDPPVQSRWTLWEAVKALETIPTPLATKALRAAAEDKDPLVRVWAISALLSRDDFSMLDRVEKLGPVPSDPSVENLTAYLGPAIARLRDNRAIPRLARLLDSKDVNVRRGVAEALRSMRDPAGIEPLIKALDDPDDWVVMQAVFGLAETTGNLEWGPPPLKEFKKQRAKYVTYWRNWAKSKRFDPRTDQSGVPRAAMGSPLCRGLFIGERDSAFISSSDPASGPPTAACCGFGWIMSPSWGAWWSCSGIGAQPATTIARPAASAPPAMEEGGAAPCGLRGLPRKFESASHLHAQRQE